MNNRCFILLSGGKINKELSSIFGEIPSGLLPIKGKPVIMHTIKNILDTTSFPVYLVLGFKKELVYDKILYYLQPKERERIKLVLTKPEYKAGYSFALALQNAKKEKMESAMVILGDTLLDKKTLNLINSNEPFIGVSQNYVDPSRWALVLSTKPLNIVDKPLEPPTKKCSALVGVYYITNIQKNNFYLKNLEISKYLEKYSEKNPFKILYIHDWVDAGHIDNYYYARKHFMISRYFNAIKYDELNNAVIKCTTRKEKLIDEINWFLKIPAELKFVCPQIYDFNLTKPYLKMEFIPYPKAEELFLYSDLHQSVWKVILNRFLNVLKLFNTYKLPISKKDYFQVYLEKLKQRLRDAELQNSILKNIIYSSSPQVNNFKCLSIKEIIDGIDKNLNRLYNKKDNSIIHGDFCFSNIFYSPESSIIKLIDPRGRWGESDIGGDIKYDYAKLSHSISGGYESILNDYFAIEVSSDKVNLSISKPKIASYLEHMFFESIPYKRETIELIEATLFLSMVPLHKDSLRRQLAMLSIGLFKATKSLHKMT